MKRWEVYMLFASVFTMLSRIESRGVMDDVFSIMSSILASGYTVAFMVARFRPNPASQTTHHTAGGNP